MTLNEFKAWLEGYSEGFADGMPTAEQWAKVKAKLETVKLVSNPIAELGKLYPDPRGTPHWPFDGKGRYVNEPNTARLISDDVRLKAIANGMHGS